MSTLQAKGLSLNQVHHMMGFQRQWSQSFSPLLSLEPLTNLEQQELRQTQSDYEYYLDAGKVSEGLVKALTVFPLLRLAGFYRFPIEICLEEDIDRIEIHDEQTEIVGRFDILSTIRSHIALEPNQSKKIYPLWILVIESKNSSVDVFAGLPQLLTYAYTSLKHQQSTWGLIANGRKYLFVYIQSAAFPTYELMPELNLFEPDQATQILQVLKAIRESSIQLDLIPAQA
jgi:hypothetical protein